MWNARSWSIRRINGMRRGTHTLAARAKPPEPLHRHSRPEWQDYKGGPARVQSGRRKRRSMYHCPLARSAIEPGCRKRCLYLRLREVPDDQPTDRDADHHEECSKNVEVHHGDEHVEKCQDDADRRQHDGQHATPFLQVPQSISTDSVEHGSDEEKYADKRADGCTQSCSRCACTGPLCGCADERSNKGASHETEDSEQQQNCGAEKQQDG